LGYTGSHNDRYFAWLLDGGAFGPNVQIIPQGTVPTVGFCDYVVPTPGNCTASRQYVANDSGFTNPANQWVWSIDPPVAGVAITAGAGTDTVTVETQNSDVDVTFNLKVVATDTVSTDSAERTAAQTQYHREDLAVTDIIEDAAGSCTYDSGLGESSCVSQATYSATITGTPDTYLWSVTDVTGGTAQIVGSATGTTCVVQTTGGAPSVGYWVSLDLTSQFQSAQLSEPFTQTKTDVPTVAPVFSGPVPNQSWTVGVAITPLDIASFFTGTAPITYALTAGTWPDGISMDTAGLVTGTPTTEETETGLIVTGTNVAGSDVTNAFQADVAAAVAGFVTTWRTTGIDEDITLPLVSTSTYNMLVDWGDGSSDTITVWNQAERVHTYAVAGDYDVAITGQCEAWYSLGVGQATTQIVELKSWGGLTFSKLGLGSAFRDCVNMVYSATDAPVLPEAGSEINATFRGCTSIVSMDLSSWDTLNVTNLFQAFFGCSSLTSLNTTGWDTSGVTSMDSTFRNCTLIDPAVSHWDVSAATAMTNMFLNSGFSQTNYDPALIAWSALTVQPNVLFHAGTAQYGIGAPTAARLVLTDPPNTWTITDGGQAP
jgi:surface protein